MAKSRIDAPGLGYDSVITHEMPPGENELTVVAPLFIKGIHLREDGSLLVTIKKWSLQ